MMTLEQMGYRLDGQSFVKNIDSYKITLFPSGKNFIRRIIKDNKVIDMRKVNMLNLENDKQFLEVLKNRPLAVQQYPTIIQKDASSHVEPIINTEIHLKQITDEVISPKQVLENEVHLK